MISIQKIIQEFYPNHPEDIIIRNEFYPSGLREIDIYNYYMSVEKQILNWIDARNVAFLLKIDNSNILKRKINNTSIKLTNNNYQDLITGRTNIIYVEQKKHTNYYIIDIDCGENLNIKHAKIALDFLIDNLNISKFEALYSSSRGIHLIVPTQFSDINTIRKNLEIELNTIIKYNKSKIKYLVNQKGRLGNTINFDLSPMHNRGLHIAKYSLTKEFLICNDVKQGLRRIKS